MPFSAAAQDPSTSQAFSVSGGPRDSGNWGQAVLVRFDAELRPSIQRVSDPQLQLAPHELGLVVWADERGEQWSVFRGTWRRPSAARATAQAAAPPPSGLASVRGASDAPAGSLAQLTTQVDPLRLPGVMKALTAHEPRGFFTPANGSVVLNPRPTFRRLAPEGAAPAATAVLTSGEQQTELKFAEDQLALPFAQLADLPAAWREGLPAGDYALRFLKAPQPAEGSQPAGDSPQISRFRVESADRRRQVEQELEDWQTLIGSGSEPLFVLVATEYLLAQQPQPYVVDAWERLEEAPRNDYLQWRRSTLAGLLRGESPQVRQVERSTGVAGIDAARELIAEGRWTEALARLQTAADGGDVRTRALADMYRGVVHAESGLAQEEAAEFFFQRALTALQDASPEDRFRAHNNYANFLLDRAQDRSLDHAFQMAAGVRSLFVKALWYWEDARLAYQAAEDLAAQLGSPEQAALAINQARLYALLADILTVLDAAEPEQRQLEAAVQATWELGAAQLDRAFSLLPADDPYLRAVAEAIRAHLAYRRGDFERSRVHAARAQEHYVAAGSLAGVESLARLLGLVALRAPQPLEPPSSAPQPSAATGLGDAGSGDAGSGDAARAPALRSFRLSHRLAEFLRGQVPADRTGRTRAGFFARRSYVYEQLVELTIADGDPLEALRFAEQAKARALQDLLALHPESSRSLADETVELEEVLAGWPDDQLGLEYFLTTERAWLFTISPQGRVAAQALRDDAQNPLAARDLVRRLGRTLRVGIDQYPQGLRQRLLQGQGFDHHWQEELHQLCRELIPAAALEQLPSGGSLLIVPHHILHYFPFAALVTETDRANRGPLEMVQPQFLIDHPCDLFYAPSLTTWQMLRRRENRPLAQAFAVSISQLPGAPPLPGTLAEVKALQEAFGNGLQAVVRGAEADKARTLELLRQPGLVLIGTHGQNFPDQPLASLLRLYPLGRDDGRLTAAELYWSHVESDLVVLSACYSGLADRSPLPSDDLFGLQRALLQSGARTVVSGQWDVYDATGPQLLGDFFANVAQGNPAPAALADAQRHFLSRLRSSSEPEPWLHPYFWAVYTVAGDDRTCGAPEDARSPLASSPSSGPPSSGLPSSVPLHIRGDSP